MQLLLPTVCIWVDVHSVGILVFNGLCSLIDIYMIY